MDKMFITIGREYGSGGHKVGQLLADRLKIAYFDKELLILAGEKGGLDYKKWENWEEKTHNIFLYEKNYEGNEKVVRGRSKEETFFELQKMVLLDIAEKESAVIIGRCADYILKKAGYPVVSAFIAAPVEKRIERTQKMEGLSEKEIRSLIRRKDKTRRKYYESHTGKQWGDPKTYDLYYDSSKYSSLNGIADDIINYIKEK